MVSVFLTIPTNKPLETALSLKSKSSETIITNNDLLQAKNQGRVQINKSVNITVYPSYRNASAAESFVHKKIPLYELITLIVPAMVLLSAVVAFRVTIGDIGDGSGSGSGSDIGSVWDAVFPSMKTCPIVAKLTVWGSLMVIVAYEYSFQFYGSKGLMNHSHIEGMVGLEVIVDDGYLAYYECDNDNDNGASYTYTAAHEIHAVDSALSGDDGASSIYVSRSECATPERNENVTSTAANMNDAPNPNNMAPNVSSSVKNKTDAAYSRNVPSSTTRTTANATVTATATAIEVKKSTTSYSEMAATTRNNSTAPHATAPSHSSTLTSSAVASKPRSTPTMSNNTPLHAPPPTSSSSSTMKPKSSPGSIPFRFIRATKGDVAAAKERWADTCKWRQEIGMDTILQKPHPTINTIKEHYPHYFHLRGKKNECCYYEQPPKMNVSALYKEGINLDMLLRHYALCCEYMWKEIEPTEEGKSIYVIDLDGIGFRDFAGDVVDFVKRASSFTGAHYPERSGSIFVINVPSWFSVIWNVVKPMVDDVTKQKITIMKYGKEAITKALMEKIDIDNIPPEYGGRSMPLGQSPEELKFMKHFEQLNNSSKY